MMKFSKRGMTTTRKIAIAIPLLLIIALGAYVALGSSRPGVVGNGPQSSSSSSSTGAVSSNGGARQPNSILDLFGNFSQMGVTSSFADTEAESQGTSHVSYAVLGQTVANSTNYYRVEFKNLDLNTSEIAWFNQQGLVDRVDVLGDKNYSGPTASLYAQAFVAAFSFIPSLSYNTTLLSGLQKTAEGVQNIGSARMDVVTYSLAAPTSTYSNYTVKIATVQGANVKLAVYWYQQFPSTSNNFFEVTSVTRA
jgi:hypothetical protein